jgi:putative transposase
MSLLFGKANRRFFCQGLREKELEALRRSVQRGRPYGASQWQQRTAERLGLESAYRSAGQPRIARDGKQLIDS